MGQNSTNVKLQSSLRPAIARNGWIVKVSVSNQGCILLVMCCIHTADTIVRYFDTEKDAVLFIERVVN